MSTVTENKFLSEEEKTTLSTIQQKTQSLIVELGEISLNEINLKTRKAEAETFLNTVAEDEKTFTTKVFEKYGKCTINPETGEITVVG
jgi:hypothetical protein